MPEQLPVHQERRQGGAQLVRKNREKLVFAAIGLAQRLVGFPPAPLGVYLRGDVFERQEQSRRVCRETVGGKLHDGAVTRRPYQLDLQGLLDVLVHHFVDERVERRSVGGRDE